MQEELRTNAFLETEELGRLMRRYAGPCVVSLLVAALYNIVDQIFIANEPELGSFGNAANTVVFPLTVVALAIAVMIGDGTCAFVSLSLGRGKTEAAHRSVGNAILLSGLAGIMLTLVYFFFQEPLLSLFGGQVNAQTFAYAKAYFTWISAGLFFYMFGQAMNPIIRSDGSPKFAMAATLAGALTNLVLDPLFIFSFHWGMEGAAAATVIGQLVTAGISAAYLFRMKAIRLDHSSFRWDGSLIGQFLSLGICSFLSQISLVAAMAAINNGIQRYGALDPVFSLTEYAQIPMAVVGIVMKFFQIVISFSVGMAAGCIPIVGYNRGAGRNDRVRSLFIRLLAAQVALGAAALILAECFPKSLIALFGASNESLYYTEFAVRTFRIYLCTMIFACVNKALFIYLQALGKALVSTLLSLVRELIFGVGFALILPYFFGLDGILYSMPMSDCLTFLISAGVIAVTIKALKPEKEEFEDDKQQNCNDQPSVRQRRTDRGETAGGPARDFLL